MFDEVFVYNFKEKVLDKVICKGGIRQFDKNYSIFCNFFFYFGVISVVVCVQDIIDD